MEECNFEAPGNILSDLFGAHLRSLQCIIFTDNETNAHDLSIDHIASMVSFKKLTFCDDSFDITDPMLLPHSLIKCRIDWHQCRPEQVPAFIRKRVDNGGPLRQVKILSANNDHDDSEWLAIKTAARSLGVSFSFVLSPSFSPASTDEPDVDNLDGGALSAQGGVSFT